MGGVDIQYIMSLVGVLCVIRIVHSFSALLYDSFLRPAVPLSKYKGKWAVVTGASDGIGKEFAIQLSKNFNVILIARSAEKLDAVAKDISRETKTIVFDFDKASESQYQDLKSQLEQYEIGVLVNNVGISYEYPTPFVLDTMEHMESIININIRAQIKITSYILPQMLSRSSGLILNMGSAAGVCPTGLLSVYSGSKAFLQYWSQALATEVASKGVHVELLNTYFVTTKMSKIRKANLTTPTPKDYVKHALSRCGEHAFESPYWVHGILQWALEFIPTKILIDQNYQMHVDIRKRALRKKEREAKKAE